ncbi:MAG: Ig-like domain repeat protein, partial [Chloroflexota bacterium]
PRRPMGRARRWDAGTQTAVSGGARDAGEDEDDRIASAVATWLAGCGAGPEPVSVPGLPGGPLGRAHAADDTVGDCTNPNRPTGLATVVAAATAGDTITFACSGTIVLTSTLTLSKNLTVDGGGRTVAISGGGTVLVLSVAGGVTVSLNHLTITDGHGHVGGGISNNGTLTISTSTISGNSAGSASGIVNFGTLTISNSTISGNSGGSGGGGINNPGTLTIYNSTISGNSAFINGGGLDNGGSAGLGNTIIAGNSSGGDCAGSASTDQGGNLDSDGSCGFGPGHTFPSPGLGSLANNGGLTQTLALLPGSPALGFGLSAICNAAPVNGLDQRGFPRPSTTCDSGAYQSQPATAPRVQPIPSVLLSWSAPAPITYGTPLGNAQLAAAATSNGLPVGGTIVYSPPPGTVLDAGPNQQLIAAFTPLGGSALTASGLVNITVLPAPTALVLSVASGPPAGRPLTLTAQVSSPAPGAPVPSGTITFSAGSTLLGSAPLVNGVAGLTTSLPAGVLSLAAVYAPSLGSLGTANFLPSSAGVPVQVGQAATTTSLSSVHSTGTIGQEQRFTAQVQTSGSISPSGMVSFYDTGTSPQTLLGTAGLDAQGRAVLLAGTLGVGSHLVQAVYEGDSWNQSSQSGLLDQRVPACTASARLVHAGIVLLDLPSPAGTGSTAPLQLRVGRGEAVVAQPAVVYCADPGRSNAQASLGGTVTAGSGPFAKGDMVQVHLSTRSAGHGAETPQAVLVDQTSKRRLALLGPFDGGSRIQIRSTPPA